jgi:predicted nucleic acid-binding protein
MLVIDASAATELLLARPSAEAIAAHISKRGLDLHAPHLIDVEIVSAVRSLVASGEADAERGEEAIADLLDLPLARYPHDILLPRMWELRDNFSAYDAAYVALAEGLSDEGVALLTTDGRLARAVHAHSAVEVLSA